MEKAYISLYRRYRPQTFRDVTGQDTAVELICRAVTKGNAAHAYLFSGPRGCGKTTVARLLAKAVNCENRGENCEPCNLCGTCRSITDGNCLDVVEIDGASNNGVADIRDLKSHVDLATFSCPRKIYIVDEVHMLTKEAFNALLKTLEEPPDSVMFILATTEPLKVPVTVRSRCQHIPFRSIGLEDMVKRLSFVADKEKLTWDKEAIWEISRQADGSLRDGLSLMEQAVSLGDGTIGEDVVARITGGGNHAELCRWLQSFSAQAESLVSLEEMFLKGASVERVANGLYRIFRDLWIVARWGHKGLSALNVSPWEGEFLKECSSRWDEACLRRLMELLASLIAEAKRGLEKDVFSGIVLSAMVPQEPRSRLEPRNEAEPKPGVVPETVSKPGDRDIFMDRYFDAVPHLVAALAFCRVDRDGENLSISVPEDRRYSFELLTGDRNAYLLQSLLAEEGFEGTVSVCWNGKKLDFSPLSQVDVVKVPAASAEPEENKDDRHDENGEGLEWAIRAVRSQTPADVLYIRRDDDPERDEDLGGE